MEGAIVYTELGYSSYMGRHRYIDFYLFLFCITWLLNLLFFKISIADAHCMYDSAAALSVQNTNMLLRQFFLNLLL